MTAIIGYEQAAKILGEFRFSEFLIVRELRFYETPSGSSPTQNIELIVECERRSPNYRLELRFSGVSGLKLQHFGGGQTRIIGLDILDVSQKQWEGISWEVIDYEHDDLAFFAKTAEIVSIAAVTRDDRL